jgi:protein phosphatase
VSCELQAIKQAQNWSTAMPTGNDDDTVEIPLPRYTGADQPPPFSALVQVDAAGLSHAGCVRPSNEDHFLICRFGRYLQTVQTNLPDMAQMSRFDERGHGFVVADGMGGNPAGEMASSQAIHILINLVLYTPDWVLRLDDESLADEVLRRAAERYRQVNRALTEQAAVAPQLRGFGTTMTLAASVGADLFVAHLGDSRAYLFRRGTLYRLTRDHTMAQRLADAGIISQEKAATHRLRHVLTAYLGDNAEDVQPDVQRVRLDDGDCLLLCTDGMTDLVRDEDVSACLAGKVEREEYREESSAQVCQRLVDRALDAGGKDNVTVIVARYRFPRPRKE